MTKKFTNTDIAKPVTKREKVFDTKCRGLYASITPANGATFSFKFYSAAARKQITVSVGRFDAERFTVEQARAKAYDLKADVGQGIDIAARAVAAIYQQRAEGKTFNEVADEYIDHLKQPVKRRGRMVPRRSSWDRVGGRLIEGATSSPRYEGGYLKRARAAFGQTLITAITRKDIATLLKGVEAAGLIGLAVNLRSALFGLFKWAGEAAQEYVQANPCTSLGERPKMDHRERALSADEIAALWTALDAVDCPVPRTVALAFKLMLCTGLRGGEVCGAQREWFVDLDGAAPTYCMPEWFTKARRPNNQPLNSLAVGIVRELMALSDATTGPLFPRGANGATFKRHALTDYMHDRGYNGWKPKDGVVRQHGLLSYLGFAEPFVPHDLRHTAATLLRRNGCPQANISFMLDHALPGGSKTTDGYTNLVAEENAVLKRPTLDLLDRLLRGIIAPPSAENVVPMRLAA